MFCNRVDGAKTRHLTSKAAAWAGFIWETNADNVSDEARLSQRNNFQVEKLRSDKAPEDSSLQCQTLFRSKLSSVFRKIKKALTFAKHSSAPNEKTKG